MAEQEQNTEQQVLAPKQLTGETISLKYKGLSFDMAVELYGYEEEYFQWDKPVPFGELKIYPVNIKDYDTFMDSIQCFTLEKKSFPAGMDIKEVKRIVKLTELEFMLDKTKNDQMWLGRLVRLLELIFHIKNGIKCPCCGASISYEEYKILAEKELMAQQARGEELHAPSILCPRCGGEGLFERIYYEENPETKRTELIIDGHRIKSQDYTRLRNIVLFQNLPDYRDTSYIDPHLKKDYEMHKKMKAKQHGNVSATLEQKMASLKVGMHYTDYEQIKKLTIRKFLIEFAMMDDFYNYNLQMMGRLCGLGGGSKEGPEHWIFKEEKDVYADGGYVSKDTMMDQLKQVS